MGIGLGVFLIIVGAVLAFGVKADLHHFDLTTIGFILMGGGVLVILLSLLVFMPRTRRLEAPPSPPTPRSAGHGRTRRPDQRPLTAAAAISSPRSHASAVALG